MENAGTAINCKIYKKVLAKIWNTRYNINCCGMIAVKREVAGYQQW